MEKFYLGMDIGSDSVGMACTDENYRLLRAKGKDLWSVRLFEPADVAVNRRMARTARRRLARRSQRIDFLQEVFAPYITDETFFLRLNNSGFCKEDKANGLNSKYSLFADGTFTDKDFYKKYPTIFHLRSELCEGKDKFDLRLYYLALHHIVKYRGHFLSEGTLEEICDIENLFKDYNAVAEEIYGDDYVRLDISKSDDFKNLALDGKVNLTDKKRKAVEIFEAKDNKSLKELLYLILGGASKLKDLFNNEDYGELGSINFSGMTDEEFYGLEESLDSDFQVLEKLRAIYNWTLFEKVLDGEKRISNAMLKLYDKHKNDLRILKHFVKNCLDKEVYFKIFKSSKETANYANYIGYTKPQRRKINVKKITDPAEFYKFLKKTIESNLKTDLSDTEKEELSYIKKEIENNSFLPKIINADNGIFPHQINEAELNEIIKNLVRDYPGFGEIAEDGFSCVQKISEIFSFKIPYYVGPLNTAHENKNGKQGNAWAERKIKEGRITPWNFDEMIDKAASNEKFIRRMTNKCTYLYGKDVLPKFSIYYQKYDVLNQLNKLCINGQPIKVELKQKLYNELFLVEKKVTESKLKEYLVANGYCKKDEAKNLNVKRKDGSFINVSMSSYITLKKILGDYIDTHIDVAEEIILLHTLNTDKSIVEEIILKKYGKEQVIKENIKALKGLTSFKDFGALSKEFLTEVYGGVDDVTGEMYTILGELYNTNQNLNEILYNEKYNFLEEINRENGILNSEVTYEDLEDLHLPPQVRRGVWQSLKMADEYITAVGRVPDKIFIEVTRNDEKDKKVKDSRKNNLLKLYSAVKDNKDVEELIAELSNEKYTNLRLRQERLYLYFLQLGKCAYTGERINLEQLNTDIYDVDHIVPQSMLKDDSLDNKVLVKREKNKEKLDNYPLKAGFTNQHSLWKYLKDKKLMSDKKYELLTRTAPLTSEDFQGFINRQLVVTSQSVKAVAELMKRKYGEQGCKIVYSKAANVDDFKQKFEIVKCRETNDLHHARDAYLNIVVGNVYDTLFSSNRDYFYKKKVMTDEGAVEEWRKQNQRLLFYRNQKDNCWIYNPENGGEKTIDTVRKTLQRFSIIVTRYTFTGKGAFYDETVYGKSDKGVSVPRKNIAPYNIQNEDGTFKYGGYKSLKTAYFSIITSLDKKGRRIKTIEAVPVYYDYLIKKDKEKLKEYFEKTVGLKGVEILVPVLKIKSLLKINGYPLRIAGMTGNQVIYHNAIEWYTDEKIDNYVNMLLKLADDKKNGKLSEEEYDNEEFIIKTNRFKDRKGIINRENNLKLYEQILKRLESSVYDKLSTTVNFKSYIINGKDAFLQLKVLEQATVLLQIIKFFKCNAELSDLLFLKGSANSGKFLTSKNISDVDVQIIDWSPCGLKERIRRV